MSLLLKHRWEHALVGAIIEAAKRSHPDGYLGRTAVQKLIYFLNVLGVPMKFNFRMYHYGPFCDDIPSTLEWLQADDIVVDHKPESHYADYSPGTQWPSLKSQFEVKLAEYDDLIQTIADVFGAMDPRLLELIATLDFSYRWVHARGGEGPWKEQTIAKFKEIKGNKFSDSELSQWYERLVNAKLIEP